MPRHKSPEDLFEIALQRSQSPFVWHEHPDNGNIAVFPKTAADADEWEARCTSMTDNQCYFVLVQRAPNGYREIIRSEAEKVPDYHDVVALERLKRGD